VSGKRPAASGCREEGGKPVVLQNADRTGRGRMPRLLYMVVERFTQGPGPVYERAAEHGRLLPDGLVYVDSWVDKRLDRCFQLMETDEPRLFDEWTGRWSDVAEFEVVPVIGSAEASKLGAGLAVAETPTAVEQLLRARLEEIQARLAELARPPEAGSGIGFGKRIGEGTNEAISRRNDIGVGTASS
jgi:hypothetical protein